MNAKVIEFTDEQIQSLQEGKAPFWIVNPHTKETFVLLSTTEFEKLRELEYDDSPWTREELEAAAWEVSERSEWDEYDDAQETP